MAQFISSQKSRVREKKEQLGGVNVGRGTLWGRSLAQAEEKSASTRNREEFNQSQHIRFPRHSRRGGCIKFALARASIGTNNREKKGTTRNLFGIYFTLTYY